ncbi:inner-membrane translocator [Cupriavidus basilensis OR16]|uniref:Inner-membrane translocator n=1 Tax=Cupriavidus basilensis OR16 TaxID=1127483 RepID=H1S1G1_9BURK|nr:inner-membrane translocator [Cupriavidus basilensis OR16]
MGTMGQSTKNVWYGLLLAALVLAPMAGAYPVFVLKVLCFALFACAFNLLVGYAVLSFGHAAFFGGAGYAAGHAMKVWGVTPEAGMVLGTLAGGLTGYVWGCWRSGARASISR